MWLPSSVQMIPKTSRHSSLLLDISKRYSRKTYFWLACISCLHDDITILHRIGGSWPWIANTSIEKLFSLHCANSNIFLASFKTSNSVGSSDLYINSLLKNVLENSAPPYGSSHSWQSSLTILAKVWIQSGRAWLGNLLRNRLSSVLKLQQQVQSSSAIPPSLCIMHPWAAARQLHLGFGVVQLLMLMAQ